MQRKVYTLTYFAFSTKKLHGTNQHLFWCSQFLLLSLSPPSGHLSSIGRMGSRLEGGGKSSFALSEKRNISAALRRRKRVSLWPPSLRSSTPSPIFFRRKEEERVEWGGEYQHQMLLRLVLQLQPHNDGYLIDNLPPSDSSERGREFVPLMETLPLLLV